jgi:peptidoglycan/xylan/chitin deacetylase (PgdA/CDA1 family)
VVVLMFHRVLDDPSYRQTCSLPEIVVREGTFRELIEYTARRYEPVDLRATRPGKSSSDLKVAFTFDDGWSDNYTVAFPIVRQYKIPITIFVCSGLVGKNAPFWPEQIVARLHRVQPESERGEIMALIERLKKSTPEQRDQCLRELSERARELNLSVECSEVDGTFSWAELKEMDRAGVTFGSHSQTHQILTCVSAATTRREVVESKTAIESALKKPCNVFAYPNGNHSPESRRILAEAGFELAVTTKCGAWTAVCDPLAIPRPNVCEANLVGLTGRFSPTMFEYINFWKTWRAAKANSRLQMRAHERPSSALLGNQ